MTQARTITYAVLLACPLAAAVIASGGRTPFEWNLCVVAIGVLALVYGLHGRKALRRGEPPALDRRVTVLALLVVGYVVFQLLPLPLPLVRLLSPQRAEIADGLSVVMPRPWLTPLSVEPAATVVALTTLLACVLCFLLVRELTWQALRRGSWVTVWPLIAIGVVEGSVALWESWSGVDVDGTYWNRNHLAGLLEMVLPLSVVWALNARRRDQDTRPARTARGMTASLVFGVAAPMLGVLMIFLGVIASASKMGYTATLFGLFTMGLVVALARLTGLARWTLLVALPVIGIAGFLLLANRDVLTIMAGLLDSPQGATGEGRLPIWIDSLALLAAFPMFGSGFGTYITAFLAYQTSGVALHWTHAHNDYLELATDLGAVGLVVFGALFGAITLRAVHLVRTIRRSGSDLVALGCLGAFGAIALHSIVDFNLYIPANTLLLAWIAGIAAGVPPRSTAPVTVMPARTLQMLVATMAVAAVALASTALMAGTPVSDGSAEAVRQSPASPYRWLDFADSLVKEGRTTEAGAAAARAVALGGRVPPVIRRAATVLDTVGQRREAAALVSSALEHGADDDAEVFDWFAERRIPTADVLAGLSSNKRALQAYLRYLMLPGTCDDAGLAWQALVAHHQPDVRLTADYMAFVAGDCQRPIDASRVWADYAGLSQPGYRVSEWVFNGDFERDPAPVPFDWQWRARSGDVLTALDGAQAFSGARSLRLVFKGPSQANHDGARQVVAVTPGTYRFTAAVRTLDLRSTDGIYFRISSSGSGPRMEVKTDQVTGTTDWRTLTADVVVPEGLAQLQVQVLRRPGPNSEKEDPLTATAWVDAVTLQRIGSTETMRTGLRWN